MMDNQSLQEHIHSLSANGSDAPHHPPLFFYDTRFCSNLTRTITVVHFTGKKIHTEYRREDGSVLATKTWPTSSDDSSDKSSSDVWKTGPTIPWTDPVNYHLKPSESLGREFAFLKLKNPEPGVNIWGTDGPHKSRKIGSSHMFAECTRDPCYGSKQLLMETHVTGPYLHDWWDGELILHRHYNFTLRFDGDLPGRRGTISLVDIEDARHPNQRNDGHGELTEWAEHVVAVVTPTKPSVREEIQGEGDSLSPAKQCLDEMWYILIAPRVDPVMIALALDGWDALGTSAMEQDSARTLRKHKKSKR